MDRNVHDCLIDQEGKNWNEFVSGWGFLLPTSFTIWFVNRFGDMVLVVEDGSVHFFDVGLGSIRRIAATREDFYNQIDTNDNANEWLMMDLTDDCIAAGLTLAPNQCYGFKVPPILGGQYSVENIAPTDLAVHYSFQAAICGQAKALPDGTEVEIVLLNEPGHTSTSHPS
jgi:hypothetical protein